MSQELLPPEKLAQSDSPPDPLRMLSGEKVATKEDWINKRRPELLRLAQHYMYGNAPAKPDKVTAKELFRDGMALDGKATVREVELRFGADQKAGLKLLIATPNKATGKIPSFVAVNFAGITRRLSIRKLPSRRNGFMKAAPATSLTRLPRPIVVDRRMSGASSKSLIADTDWRPFMAAIWIRTTTT